ncbi:MAG: hypothetical protein ACRCW1_06455, partial [Anaerotignaceae bacterium]
MKPLNTIISVVMFLICIFVLYMLNAHWWQYILAILILIRWVYNDISKTAREENQLISQHFKETALSLYGQFYYIKTNLPWIIIISFFAVALILRIMLNIYLPIAVYVILVITLT